MSSAHTVVQLLGIFSHSRRQNETWCATGEVSCQHLSLHKVLILIVFRLPHFHGLLHCASKVDTLSMFGFCVKKIIINIVLLYVCCDVQL